MIREFQHIKQVFFIGIGGIGMSALARYFNANGAAVSGYDRSASALTTMLQEEGINVYFEDDISLLTAAVDLVVYTPAVPATLKLLLHAQRAGIVTLKRAVVLGKICYEGVGIAVAGTHGKTSTSGMIAHLLNNTNEGCNAFVGGVMRNYDSNLLTSATSDRIVLEADEYDRSFLSLQPTIAIITSVDEDHLDVYKNSADLIATFEEFANGIKTTGKLIVEKSVLKELTPPDHIKVYSYSVEEQADFYASNISLQAGRYHFDFNYPGGVLKNIELGVAGKYNISNAVAALAVSWLLEMPNEEMLKSMASFKGIKRRFELKIASEEVVMIDDYAHHPKEIEAAIISAREAYPARKLTLFFQPHHYSRTLNFTDEFAAALSLGDEVYLFDIYHARGEIMEGVSATLIADKMDADKVKLVTKEQALALIQQRELALLLVMGAGDIDRLVPKIEELLRNKIKIV